MKLFSLSLSRLLFLLCITSTSLLAMASPMATFNQDWQILGPFQISTREAAWGADPLELHGGFHGLSASQDTTFPSSLAPNGTVGWSATAATTSSTNTSSDAKFSVSFPHIDWHFQQQIYGWAALQWQAWARGTFTISPSSGRPEEPVTVTLQASSILEYWVDDEHVWGGDYFDFRRAPLVLHLLPGEHAVELRLVRETRAMGGLDSDIVVDLSLAAQSDHEPLVQHGTVLIADLIHVPWDENSASLATPFVQALVRNNDADETIVITGVAVENDPDAIQVSATLLSNDSIQILPGQTRPIGMYMERTARSTGEPESITLQLQYTIAQFHHSLELRIDPGKPKSTFETHKITHLHPSSIVSHSLLRPPSQKAIETCWSTAKKTKSAPKLPILLVLHGAGVDITLPDTSESMNALPDLCAYTLWPSGVTEWSSDDWHTFGSADISAAVDSIPYWRNSNGAGVWPEVDTTKWLVVGHSNGGQGAWSTLLHYPDNIIAAAPVSGYSSIQNYVPYTFWRAAEAGKMAVVQSALEGWKHELLLPMAKGIPILQQHGGADDNVPAYHSRLMHSLLPEAGWESSFVEVPEMPHWWDGILTTPALGDFYEKSLQRYLDGECDNDTVDGSWRVVTANPAESGGKHGIKILLLERPGQLGKISVDCNTPAHTLPESQRPLSGDQGSICHIQTSNIRAFELPVHLLTHGTVTINDQSIGPLPATISAALKPPADFVRRGESIKQDAPIPADSQERIILHRWPSSTRWVLRNLPTILEPLSELNKPRRVRWGRQLGSIDTVMRTRGPIHIVPHTSNTIPDNHAIQRLALQISRNLQSYYHADSAITTYFKAQNATGNVISLTAGVLLPASSDHGISVLPDGDGITLRTSHNTIRTYHDCSAIFLRPIEAHARVASNNEADVNATESTTLLASSERVELVVWGDTMVALEQAVRLVPMMTGTGQPDFVVLREAAMWKGLEGAVALGWFDEHWLVSGNSYIG